LTAAAVDQAGGPGGAIANLETLHLPDRQRQGGGPGASFPLMVMVAGRIDKPRDATAY